MAEEGGHISGTVEVCNFLYAFRGTVVNILYTVVWEIFVRDNLVVKFIRCVIFSWVSYTH